MNSSGLFKASFTCLSQFPTFIRSIMNVVFFGSDHYALPHLRALEERQSQHKDIQLLFVVTTSDKTPIGYHCIQNKIDHIIWPRTLPQNSIIINAISERIEKLQNTNDYHRFTKPPKLLGLIVSFGRFLPYSLVSLFNYGCYNIHPSLLPRWKGSSPLLYTLLTNDQVTGITLFRLNPMHRTFDSGSVLYQKSIRLPSSIQERQFTPDQLATYLMPHSIKAMFEVILYPNLPYLIGIDQSVISDKFQLPITYARKPHPRMGLINWHRQSAEDIIRCWYAFQGSCVNLFTELCLLNTDDDEVEQEEEKENHSLVANFRLLECPLLVPPPPHLDCTSKNNDGQYNTEADNIYCPDYEPKIMNYLKEASILLHQPYTLSLPPGSIVYLRSQTDRKHHLIPYTFIACKSSHEVHTSPNTTPLNNHNHNNNSNNNNNNNNNTMVSSWIAVKRFLVNWPNSSTTDYRHLTAIDLYNSYFLKYIHCISSSSSSTLATSVIDKKRPSRPLGIRLIGEFRSSSLLNSNQDYMLIKSWNELTPNIFPSDLQLSSSSISSERSMIVQNCNT
ncbi:unnamed protein product [Schistosoma turkestanicum]|nr:unnamed protein product [Schistosoma turkestanicum]